MWLDWVFAEAFGTEVRLGGHGRLYFDTITEKLQQDEFRPRALFDRYGIEVLATTESPLADLARPSPRHSRQRVERPGHPAYRPDAVVDPEFEGFVHNLAQLGELTGEDTMSWPGYRRASPAARFFAEMGATSSDHGHPTADRQSFFRRCTALFERVKHGNGKPPMPVSRADAHRNGGDER